MPDANNLPHGPMQYAALWLLLGLAILMLIISWYGFVAWSTRKRRILTINDIARRRDEYDLAAIKTKYYGLIDEVYMSYKRNETTLRGLHRGLSMAVRYFVFEVTKLPAPKLTLADLKRAPYPELSSIIEEYYKGEFAAVKHGEATDAVAAAREFISKWG